MLIIEYLTKWSLIHTALSYGYHSVRLLKLWRHDIYQVFHVVWSWCLAFFGICREYLGNGITVWLDVPVKVLAKRVTAVGTGSRPLLGDGCADFESVLLKLSTLMKERKAQYSKAHCRLCFEGITSLCQCLFICCLECYMFIVCFVELCE